MNVNPPQRIALMRLVLCITQAALDGPENEEDWERCRDRIIPDSLRYLASRHDQFHLYGEQPFLQHAGLLSKELASLDKLFETSRGENPMFLTQRASEGKGFPDAEKALALFVFVNFSAGGKVGQAIWDGIQSSESTFTTPCFNNFFLFLRGKNLLETVWLNVLPKNRIPYKWGTPVWDNTPQHPHDDNAFENAYSSYLGRAVPFTRLVKLPPTAKESDCVIGPVPKRFIYSNDLKAFRDPYLTIRLPKSGEHYYMKMNLSKHVWRELGSVLALHNEHEGFSPINLLNLEPLNRQTIDIWCGGLAKGAQAAKIYDMAEWNFSLPVSLLGATSLEKYKQGVVLANAGEAALKNAVQTYEKSMKIENGAYTRRATLQYWSTLDSHYQTLIDIASDGNRDLGDWRKQLLETMREAFERACPHETPRQIQAYVQANVQAKKRLKIKDEHGQ